MDHPFKSEVKQNVVVDHHLRKREFQNSLPQILVEAKSLNIGKTEVDRYLLNKRMKGITKN